MHNLPIKTQIYEVGTRDGFQMEKQFIATEDKVNIIDQLSEVGFRKIEVTSFVSPKAVPQLQDAAEVMKKIKRKEGVVYSALIPNVKGAQRAIDAGANEINVVISASESHNQSNLRMTREMSLRNLKEIVSLSEKMGIPVNLTIATTFGCPFEGKVSPDSVFQIADQGIAMGVSITLADTIGVANPRQVYSLTTRFREKYPALNTTLHLHDTRGMGLANFVAGLEAGITQFDSSLGGIGGCPFAPGATGNVATEDVAYMLKEMDIQTGISFERLMGVARLMERVIGRQLPGKMLRTISQV